MGKSSRPKGFCKIPMRSRVVPRRKIFVSILRRRFFDLLENIIFLRKSFAGAYRVGAAEYFALSVLIYFKEEHDVRTLQSQGYREKMAGYLG